MAAPPALARDDTLVLAAEVPTSISRSIAARVASRPDGLVRTYDGNGIRRSVSYEAAWLRSARIASALQQAGAGKGRPVVLVIEDAVDFLPAFWACLRGGHIAVALQSAVEAAAQPLGQLTLRNLLRKLENPLILVDEHFARNVVIGALAAEYQVMSLSAANDVVAPWDDAVERPSPVCLVATSGATGSVKLVTIEEKALLHRYFSADRPGPKAGVNSLGIFPIDSMSGLRMGFLVCETFTQIPKHALTVDPEVILYAVDALRISNLSLTNSLALRLIEIAPTITRPLDFRSVRSCGLGGEAVARDIAARLGAMLARHGSSGVVLAGYGATEIGDIVSAADPLADGESSDQSVRLGACAPGVSMRIVGEQGIVLAEGEIGEVEVAAPLKAFSGYWGEPDLTQSYVTPDGWWKTGDLGQLDAGVFTFRGRSKQVLVINGKKLSLTEIDACLRARADIGVEVFSCALRSAGDATDRLAIAFVRSEGTQEREVADAIQSAVLREFGIRADPVVALPRHRLPLTSTGKVRRSELPALVAAERATSGEADHALALPACYGRDAFEATLVAIWCDVLNLDADFDRERSFFEWGGDSLRSAALYACIEAKLGRQVAMDTFFAQPTFVHLLGLLDGPDIDEAADAGEGGWAWPLPPAFRARQLAVLETWPGRRVTSDRLLLGWNTCGGRPPLFCVLNAVEEHRGLRLGLAPQQPIYTFRSAHGVADYTEDNVQAIALSYVRDIEQVCPTGPLFLLGQCQGATLAIAMAQHLMRRGRHVPVLVLAEWTTESVFYPGPTLLLFGRDSRQHPRRFHYDSAMAWRRMLPDHEVVEVPGVYGQLYSEDNVHGLADELSRRFIDALPRAPRILPRGACELRFDVRGVPDRLIAGRRSVLNVSMRNTGGVVVSSRASGLLVGNYWTRDDDTIGHRLDARVWIPDLRPGETWDLRLDVRPPRAPGRYRLCIDVVEEGHRWLNPINRGGFHADVDVDPPEPIAVVSSVSETDLEGQPSRWRLRGIRHGNGRGS